MIYACTGKISPEIYQKSKEILNSVGVIGEFTLKFWGIDEITRLLKTYYPALAEEFLGIRINQGCIVPIDEFGNKFNVTQDNLFLFRDAEKKEIKQILKNGKSVFL